MKTRNNHFVAAVAFALLTIVLSAVPAGAAFSWTGDAGSKDWFDTAPVSPPNPPNKINNWGRVGNPPAFPTLSDSVTIASPWAVDILSGTASAGGLTLGATASLDINNFSTLVLAADSAINGTLSLSDGSGAGSAILRISGDVGLTGTGSVRFDSEYVNYITYTFSTDVLTLGADQVIETVAASDKGEIKAHLVNNGLLDANAGTITLETRAKTNNELIRARNGGTMDVNSIVITNTGATLRADATSAINLNSATIVGGTIDGGGDANVGSVATLDGVHLDGVTARIGNLETLTLKNTATNDGVISLEDDSGAGSSTLSIADSLSLTGTGQVLFTSPDDNAITYTVSSNILTLGANQVIRTDAPGDRGEIRIGLINDGLVDTNGGTLTLKTRDKTNNTLIRATNSGVLDVNSITITNTGATLKADATSAINLNGATIVGGTIDGGGDANVGSVATLDGVHLGNVKTRIGNLETLTLKNTATNDGVISLEDSSSAGSSTLSIADSLSLTGTGQVLFTSPDDNVIAYTVSSNILTLGANQVIKTETPGDRGEIRIELINDGLVDTDGGTLTLKTRAKTNNTLIRARNGGVLDVNSIVITNTGATLKADATSEINLSGATIVGGTVDGGGDVNVISTATLDGAHLDDVTVRVGNLETLTLPNSMTNDGVISLEDDSGAGSSTLSIADSLSLTGTGEVLFTSPDNNVIAYTVSSNILTLGANQVIKTEAPGDEGEIRIHLINDGLVDTDGGTITLQTRGKTNNTLIRARNGGTLNVNSITITNTGATLRADATSEINLSGATIVGGTVDGGGDVNVISTATLDGAHLDDVTVRVGNLETLTLPNSMTNDGVISLEDSTSAGSSTLKINGDLSLTGSGEVRFTSAESNLISYALSSNVLTNGPDHSIFAPAGGNGTVRPHLVNHGDVIADGTIGFMSGRTITNAPDGTIGGSGTIDLNGATLVGDGTISPGNSAGTLTIDGNVPFSSSSELLIEIFDDTLATGYDVLDVSGIVDLGGTLRVRLLPGSDVHIGDTFNILTATDINGNFDNLIFPTYGGGLPAFSLNRTDQVATLTALTDIPEPATLTLLALGAVALLRRRNKR